jgi:hypothetical protein
LSTCLKYYQHHGEHMPYPSVIYLCCLQHVYSFNLRALHQHVYRWIWVWWNARGNIWPWDALNSAREFFWRGRRRSRRRSGYRMFMSDFEPASVRIHWSLQRHAQSCYLRHWTKYLSIVYST